MNEFLWMNLCMPILLLVLARFTCVCVRDRCEGTMRDLYRFPLLSWTLRNVHCCIGQLYIIIQEFRTKSFSFNRAWYVKIIPQNLKKIFKKKHTPALRHPVPHPQWEPQHQCSCSSLTKYNRCLDKCWYSVTANIEVCLLEIRVNSDSYPWWGNVVYMCECVNMCTSICV